MERFEELFPKPTELEWHHASIFSAGDLWKIRKDVWEAALSESAGPTNEPGFDEATEARWQKAIYEVCKEAVGPEHYSEIDGAGCDSGDALDFTITEIQQALEFVRENSRSAPDREATHHLRNLLAVIHRDGGHYAGEHGLSKASQDAEKIIFDLMRVAESPSESAPAPEGMVRNVNGELLNALENLFALVKGECPSLLENDHHYEMCKNAIDRAMAHPTSESGTDAKLPIEIVDLLTNVAQLLDVIKGEWGDEWSAWDQEQRDAITKHLMAYHYPDSGRSGDKQVLCAARHSNTGANDPQDCDWPFCGCDPKADKVIEAIEESGFKVVKAESGTKSCLMCGQIGAKAIVHEPSGVYICMNCRAKAESGRVEELKHAVMCMDRSCERCTETAREFGLLVSKSQPSGKEKL